MLEDRASIPALIAAADREDTRFEAVAALAAMPDAAAFPVYLRALGDKSPDLRRHAASAVGKIRDQAVPLLDQLAKRNELPPTALPELRNVFAIVQPILTWQLLGPFPSDASAPFPLDQPIDPAVMFPGADEKPVAWKSTKAGDPRGQIDLGRIYSQQEGLSAFGYAEIDSPADRVAAVAVGSDDTLTVWVNGEQVYQFSKNRGFSHEQDRFDVKLKAGKNRIVIQCGNNGRPLAVFRRRRRLAGLRVSQRAVGRAVRPRALSCRSFERDGRRSTRADALRRSQGAGLHQVPRRGKGRGRGWSRTVERRRQVSPRRVDRLGPLPLGQDLQRL